VQQEKVREGGLTGRAKKEKRGAEGGGLGM